jgi:hypothetical protein
VASAFDINVIEEESVENLVYEGIEGGFQFRIRFTAYRGSHLSCIESFQLKLDGKEVNKAQIRFCLNGKEFLIDQLKDLYQEYWFIQNSAIIKVMNGEALRGTHQIDVRYSFRIPYTGYFGSYMVQEGIGSRSVNICA